MTFAWSPLASLSDRTRKQRYNKLLNPEDESTTTTDNGNKSTATATQSPTSPSNWPWENRTVTAVLATLITCNILLVVLLCLQGYNYQRQGGSRLSLLPLGNRIMAPAAEYTTPVRFQPDYKYWNLSDEESARAWQEMRE